MANFMKAWGVASEERHKPIRVFVFKRFFGQQGVAQAASKPMITKSRFHSLHPIAFQLDYRIKYKPQPPLCILFVELLAHPDQTSDIRLKESLSFKLLNSDSALYLFNFAAPPSTCPDTAIARI